MKLKLKNWAIVYNPTKTGTKAVAGQLAKVLLSHGAKPDVMAGPIKSLKGYDIGASVGGDGTLLGLVEAALAAKVPLVGVNMGKLGYLACIAKENLKKDIKRILEGEFRQLERCVIEANFPNGKKYHALNDVVIKSADFRLAELKVLVDDEVVSEYSCDGLIFATATGSTAYNLSAGGPILHQGAKGVVMTPICAHTLTNRSVLFDPSSLLTIEGGKTNVHINIDGRATAMGHSCMPLRLQACTRSLVTLEDPKRGHFATLRQKLNWK